MKLLLALDVALAAVLIAAVLILPSNSAPTWALSVVLTVCIALTTAVATVRLSARYSDN